MQNEKHGLSFSIHAFLLSLKYMHLPIRQLYVLYCRTANTVGVKWT